MSCEFLEKVSLLVDGELEIDEARQVKQHLFGCGVCRQAQQDFLKLRQQLQTYDVEVNEFAKQKALRKIFASERVSIWSRKVSLPVPTLALLVLALVALAVMTLSQRQLAQQAQKPHVAPGDQKVSQVSQRGIDFSRYDTGERAVIYKTRRAETTTSAP